MIKARAVQAGRIATKVVCHKVDIARLDDVKAMYDHVSEPFGGRLDILVNNAAHM
jgi:NAD(P)-dependent dehydrogenase (short-subunit alcohol dehydrogenase family)